MITVINSGLVLPWTNRVYVRNSGTKDAQTLCIVAQGDDGWTTYVRGMRAETFKTMEEAIARADALMAMEA